MKKLLLRNIRTYAIFIILIIEIIIFSILSPHFFTIRNFLNISRQISFITIIALGEGLCLLIGGLDLSVGYIVTFVNILGAMLLVNAGLPISLVIIIVIAAATIIGLTNGGIITLTNMPPMICTLAMMTMLEGIANTMSGGKQIYGFPNAFVQIGQGSILGIPNVTIIAIICLIIGWIFLNKTYLGRFFYAIGGNEDASRLSGIRVNRYKRLAYCLSGFFAGLSGVLLLSRLNTGAPETGVGYEFDTITALVLGGTSVNGGRLKISYIISGVLVIGVMETGFVLINVGTYTQSIVKGIILIIAVSFDCLSNKRKN